MSAPKAKDTEVGVRYSITVERHASKPLWRLRERGTVRGKPVDIATQWRNFTDTLPDLILAQGRLRDFIVTDLPRSANVRA